MVYSTKDLDSHADTIFCVSNCVIMYFTGKEYDVATYTEAYKIKKAVPIFHADTEYENTETGETTTLILNEAIWMGEIMYHTLVNPNQLRAYEMTVQDKHFSEAPIFVAMEDHDFMLVLSSKGNILGVTTITPTDKELQTYSHVTCSSVNEWDPQNFCFALCSL